MGQVIAGVKVSLQEMKVNLCHVTKSDGTTAQCVSVDNLVCGWKILSVRLREGGVC